MKLERRVDLEAGSWAGEVIVGVVRWARATTVERPRRWAERRRAVVVSGGGISGGLRAWDGFSCEEAPQGEDGIGEKH